MNVTTHCFPLLCFLTILLLMIIEVSLVVVALIAVVFSPSELYQLLTVFIYNFALMFLWLFGLLELPSYPTIQHGAWYWTNTDLCETLHLLFWLCLRWLALMLWFISPTSPVVFTLDPPTEY